MVVPSVKPTKMSQLMKLSPEHQTNEEGLLPEGILDLLKTLEEDDFQWSRKKLEIIQNLGCFGEGTQMENGRDQNRLD